MNVILALFGKTLSPLWSAVAEAGAVAVAVLLAWLVFAHHYEAEGAARVQAAIDAPVTGWAARLAQCQANGATLTASLNHQNAAVAAVEAQGQSDTAKAEKAAIDARSLAEGYRKQAASIGAKRPVGGDVCSRMLNVDSKVTAALQ